MLRFLLFNFGIHIGRIAIGDSSCDSSSCIVQEPSRAASLLQVKHAQEPIMLPNETEETAVIEDPLATPVNGSTCTWEAPEICQPSFVYKGLVRTGCIMVDHPTPWCSHDKEHIGNWSVCTWTCDGNLSFQNESYDPYEDLINSTGGKWVNQHTLNSTDDVAPPMLGRAPRLPQDECTLPLIRFANINDINSVRPITQGKDEYFPADESSIAPPGANCGDSAHNIFVSCSKYNQWSTMDSVSRAYGFSFAVFSSTGSPAYTDVRQGQLGTCYFLAAIASIAYRAPQVIEDMFVRREYWKQGIISTRWLVNGVESIIEVDKTIPAQGQRPYFATLDRASGAWWPAILEKAWSKIYGSYKATEGGWWAAAAAAITRAPTVTYFTSKMSYNELWQVLLSASQNKWPMGAGTRTSNYGLAAGHAYSVLDVWEDASRGKLVRVRNPWHSNYYKGSIPNPSYGDDSGIFTMSFDEFRVAFFITDVAKVMPSYDVTSKRVCPASGCQSSGPIQGALRFSISTNKWFTVSVVWPNHRMLCKTAHPSYVLAVRQSGQEKVFYPEPSSFSVNAAYVELPPGSGTYQIAVSVDFPVNTFIHEVQVNVYAESQVAIEPLSVDYSSLTLGMVGPASHGTPCEVITIANRGLWKVNMVSLIGGVPTYDSWDGKQFAYYVSFKDQWFIVGKQYFDKVSQGRLYSFGKVSKNELICGCLDSPAGVRGFRGIGCKDVKAPKYKYSNVRCDADVPYKSLVQSYCPVTCNVDVCSNNQYRKYHN